MGKKKKKTKQPSEAPEDNLRLSPEKRLCAKVDSVSIDKYPVATREEMGVRVRDNCAEEHIM